MEKTNEKLAEKNAAHQLMIELVKENASEVANAISMLTPFLCGECNLSELKSALNVVNITFATVALDVIESRNENNETEHIPLCLPVDAMEMQNALYTLSRFLKKFAPLANFMEQNKDMPAFKLSISSYDQVDSI